MKRFPFRLAAVALVLAAGGIVAASSLATTWPLGRLPLWDGAGNGWGALELWAALAEGRPLDFVIRLNAQDKWPFGFSLLVLPFVAIGGGSFESATLFPALAFALVPALLLGLARELTPDVDRGTRGLAAGAIAAALWLTSPLPRAFATVVMRETAGAALAVALAAAYLRARRVGTLAAWRLCAGLLLALFWTKYNYVLLIGLPLALHALLELDAAGRWALGRRLSDAVLRRGWRSPARWIALLAALALGALLVGQNPGGLIYAALLLGTVFGLSLQWKSLRLWSDRIRDLNPAVRALFETFLLPLWLWSLSPDPIHPRSVIAFLRNRPGESPPLSIESWEMPVRSFVLELAPTRGLGVAIALVASAAALRALARRGPQRAVALAALVGFALVCAHPMKEARFLLTVAPFLFLAAGVATADVLAALRPAAVARAAPIAAGAVATLIAGVAPFRPAAFERLRIDHRQLTGERAFAAPLDAIVERLALRRDSAYLGATNELSESLVRWRAFARLGAEQPLAGAPRGIDAALPPAERERRLDEWIERTRPSTVVALQPLPGSRWLSDRDYLRYNAWQIEAFAALEAKRRFRGERAERFPAVGLAVKSWRLRSRPCRP